MSTPDTVTLARRIATEAHQGQYRRDGVTPYIRHPEAVAAQVAGRPLLEAIAWLHDVVEDTSVSSQQLLDAGLPAEVVRGVELLTKREGTSYEAYLERIKPDPVARQVKVADLLANLADHPSESQIRKYAKALLILLP